MKLKPQFQKGSTFVKSLKRSINLGVATDAELKLLKDTGIYDYLFEEELIVIEEKTSYNTTEFEEELLKNGIITGNMTRKLVDRINKKNNNKL